MMTVPWFLVLSKNSMNIGPQLK